MTETRTEPARGVRAILCLAATLALAAGLPAPAAAGDGNDERIPLPTLKLAPEIYMPGSPQAEARIDEGVQEPPARPFVDSSSPAYWMGSSFALIHSAGVPAMSVGTGIESFEGTGGLSSRARPRSTRSSSTATSP